MDRLLVPMLCYLYVYYMILYLIFLLCCNIYWLTTVIGQITSLHIFSYMAGSRYNNKIISFLLKILTKKIFRCLIVIYVLAFGYWLVEGHDHQQTTGGIRKRHDLSTSASQPRTEVLGKSCQWKIQMHW